MTKPTGQDKKQAPVIDTQLGIGVAIGAALGIALWAVFQAKE